MTIINYARTLHASRHASGGADPVTIAESQVTGLVSALAAKADASAIAPLALAGQTPSQAPVAPGTSTVGSLAFAARADHIHPSAGLFGWLGTGADGAATFDGTATPGGGVTKVSSTLYRLTQDVNYSAVTGSAGVEVDTQGYAFNVLGTITGPGSGTFTISVPTAPASGTNNGTGGAHFPNLQRYITLGVGAASVSGGTGVGAAGGNLNDIQIPRGNGGNGGSGASGAGGTGGSSATNSGTYNTAGRFQVATTGRLIGLDALLAANSRPPMVLGGNSGGAGGGDGTNVGGAGGTGGNVVIVNALKVVGNVNVTAPGGAAGTPTTGNCGGGGGGTGGWAVLNSVDLTGWTGAVSAAGGTAGSGVGTGTAGTAGAAGVAQATTWV